MKNGTGVVIVHGPMASGKTRYAAQLMRLYGCGRVVDGWNEHMRLEAGDLALTLYPPPYKAIPGAVVHSIADALAKLHSKKGRRR